MAHFSGILALVEGLGICLFVGGPRKKENILN